VDVELLDEKLGFALSRFPNSVTTLWDLKGQTPPEREWVWAEMLPSDSVVLLGGPPGAGKSLVAQQMCMAMAGGHALFDIPMKAIPTLYITCEDSRDEVWRRGLAIAKCLGLRDIDLHDFFFDSWQEDPETVLDAGNKLQQLAEFVRANNIKFLVLDLLPDYWRGNEIVRSEVNAFMKGVLGTFAAQTKCTVMGLHHPSKSGLADGSGTSGSTSWEGSVRQRLYLTGEDITGIRTLEVKKSNYGSKPVINLKWKRFTEQAGAFISTADERQMKNRELGKNERPFLEAIPIDGIAQKEHRQLFTDRQAYSKSKKSLEADGLVSLVDGIFYRADASPRRSSDKGDT
jgi:RecA-family ATPase